MSCCAFYSNPIHRWDPPAFDAAGENVVLQDTCSFTGQPAGNFERAFAAVFSSNNTNSGGDPASDSVKFSILHELCAGAEHVTQVNK